MDAPHPNCDAEKAEIVLTPSRPTGRNNQDNCGSATMIGSQGESAGASVGRNNTGALGAADWVTLAAAPTFAIMALLVAASSKESALSGMVLMYVLMAVFESVAWLKLISNRRSTRKE